MTKWDSDENLMKIEAKMVELLHKCYILWKHFFTFILQRELVESTRYSQSHNPELFHF